MAIDSFANYYATKAQNNAARRDYLYQNRNILSAQAEYERSLREAQVEADKQAAQAEAAERRAADATGTQRFWHSVGDWFGSVIAGISKGTEGMIDGTAAQLALLAPEDSRFSQNIRDFVSKDWTGDNITAPMREKLWASTLKDDGIGRGIGQGIGQMLPAIALSAIPYAGAGLSMAYLMSSAAGNATEEAWREGGGTKSGAMYGMVQGGIEGLIEYASGKLGAGIKAIAKPGASLVGKGVGGVAKQIGKQALSEAAEEGVQELITPLTKTIYKGKSALDEYKDPGFAGQVAKSALIGGAVGGIMQGASYGVAATKAGGINAMSVAENVQELSTLAKKADNMDLAGKRTGKAAERLNAEQAATVKVLSESLTAMPEAKRTAAIERYGIADYFNADGTPTQRATTAFINGTDNGAVSPSLRGRTDLVVQPTTAELSEGSRVAKQTLSDLGGGVKLVIADAEKIAQFGNMNAGQEANGIFSNGVLYIPNNLSATDAARIVSVHEITHTLEGTPAYGKLFDYAAENYERITKKTVTDKDGTVRKRTFKDALKDAQAKYEKSVEGKTENRKGYVYETEALAEVMSELLSNEQSIKRIATQNKGLFARIFEWVRGALARLRHKGATNTEQYRYLRGVEKLYANALKAANGGVDINVLEAINKLKEEAKQEGKTESNGTKFSLKSETRGEKAYSHETLTAKPDMEVTQITENVPRTADNKVDRKAIIAKAKENARAQNNPKNIETQTYVRVADINQDVIIGTPGLSHGLTHGDTMTAKVLLKIGDILKNSIAINELNGRAKGSSETEMSYVLLGYANVKGVDYAIRTVVDKLSGEATEFDVYKLNAIKAKEKAGRMPPPVDKNGSTQDFGAQAPSPVSPATISIRNLLENVKEISLIAEAVSKDVAETLGIERPKGTLSESIRFSIAETDSQGRKLSTEQREFFKDSKVVDDEGRLIEVYHLTDSDFYTFKRKFLGENTVNNASSETLVETSKLGFWFSEKSTHRFLKAERTIPAYLSIINPFEVESLSQLEQYLEGTTAKKYLHDLRMEGYDGIIVSYDDELNSISYVAFNSNQIKAVDNKAPTSRRDIRFSLKDGDVETSESYKYSRGQVARMREDLKFRLSYCFFIVSPAAKVLTFSTVWRILIMNFGCAGKLPARQSQPVRRSLASRKFLKADRTAENRARLPVSVYPIRWG